MWGRWLIKILRFFYIKMNQLLRGINRCEVIEATSRQTEKQKVIRMKYLFLKYQKYLHENILYDQICVSILITMEKYLY